jgi:hypothetical protein
MYVGVDSNETVSDFSEVISSGFAAWNRCACHYSQRDSPMNENHDWKVILSYGNSDKTFVIVKKN